MELELTPIPSKRWPKIREKSLMDVCRDPEIRSAAFGCLVYLMYHRNPKSGLCYPGVECLAEELDVHPSSVLRGIEKLRAAKILRIDRTEGPTRYYFSLDEAAGVDKQGTRKLTHKIEILRDATSRLHEGKPLVLAAPAIYFKIVTNISFEACYYPMVPSDLMAKGAIVKDYAFPRSDVYRALDLLKRQGYLIEHSEGAWTIPAFLGEISPLNEVITSEQRKRTIESHGKSQIPTTQAALSEQRNGTSPDNATSKVPTTQAMSSQERNITLEGLKTHEVKGTREVLNTPRFLDARDATKATKELSKLVSWSKSKSPNSVEQVDWSEVASQTTPFVATGFTSNEVNAAINALVAIFGHARVLDGLTSASKGFPADCCGGSALRYILTCTIHSRLQGHASPNEYEVVNGRLLKRQNVTA